MIKLVVIGGGAAGMVAALKASEKCDVILLEGNDKLGKKLLLTGNGRCNFWNEDLSVNKYITDDVDNLNLILSRNDEVFKYLVSLGVCPKNKDGLYYPYSNLASSMQQLLINHLMDNHVDIRYGYKVNKLVKENGVFIINDDIACDKVIITTGLKAYPKTGSDGSLLDIISTFGHDYGNVLPALTHLKTNVNNELVGVRTNAKVSLYIDDELIKEDIGELQFVKDGISGICVFNLSGLGVIGLNDNKNVCVKVDFTYFINNIRNYLSSDLPLSYIFETMLNYKITNVLFKNIDLSKTFKELSKQNQELIINNLTNYSFNITGSGSFEEAQVCSGGIKLHEVDKDMHSKLATDLAFAGEVLNVCGDCGGYNLAFAFISGYIAGKMI